MTRRMMLAAAAAIAAGAGLSAQNGTPINQNSANALTVAVYGDSPYGASPTDTSQTDKTPAFIASINADPKVDLVLHVGDIHSGKQFCTEAYDRAIFDLWTAFKDPLVYLPGDNEWTDCHKAAEGGHVVVNGSAADFAGGDPTANLDLVRAIFFPVPGLSLGGRRKALVSQASHFDPRVPGDARYVENVMWLQSRVLFVTLNVPGGSNNDDDNWFGQARTDVQTDEVAARTGADLRWLDTAFEEARAAGAEAAVVALQADMWDLDSKPATHIAGYEPIIASLASHALAFGKPVLLFNGDSHHFRSDNPLQQGQPCAFEASSGTATVACASVPAAPDFTPDAWTNHPSYAVPNFHRVVVHGSTEPLEWIRLTITPGRNDPATADRFGPFAWERVQPLP